MVKSFESWLPLILSRLLGLGIVVTVSQVNIMESLPLRLEWYTVVHQTITIAYLG